MKFYQINVADYIIQAIKYHCVMKNKIHFFRIDIFGR